MDINISHSTIVVDNSVHCSRVVTENILLVFSVDLDPVKPCKKIYITDPAEMACCHSLNGLFVELCNGVLGLFLTVAIFVFLLLDMYV